MKQTVLLSGKLQTISELEKKNSTATKKKRFALYDELLSDFAPSIIIPRISEDSIIPEYLRNELQTIINRLCAFDYRKRAKESNLDGIKEKIRLIIRILENEHLREVYKKRKEIHRKKIFSANKSND